MGEFRIEALNTRDVGPINLHIRPGECVCISGASGSGKTQLLRSLVDLDPHDGQVFLDEQEAGQVIAHHWRRLVGYLPAQSQWWYEQVGDHFSDIESALLDAVGFDSDILQRRIDRLSTGEKQRLALCRLLANKPQVLLLDEPTASLDADTARRVEQVILDYQRENQTAMIWVSHYEIQINRVADRHFQLQDRGLMLKAAP